ncbi:hypothetical protein AZKH_1136 [Azoarcus sp. KH32C]|nr:hypothetical protein AZKH_1136 [Azoarcus sp. KH32C]
MTNRYGRRYARIGGSPASKGGAQAMHLVPESRLGDFLTSPYDAPLMYVILADKRLRLLRRGL